MKNIINLIVYNYEEKRLKAFWRIIVFFIVFAGLFIFLESLSRLINLRLLAYIIDQSKINILQKAMYTLVPLFAAALSVAVCRPLIDRRNFASLGLKINKKWVHEFLIGVLLGAILITFVYIAEISFGFIEFKNFNISSDVLFFLFVNGIIFLSVGFYEELITRGVLFFNIYDGMRSDQISKAAALLIATFAVSALFSVGHLANPGFNYIAAVNIFLAGILLSLGVIFSRSLALPVGAHFSWNYFQGAIYGFSVSGIDAERSLIEQIHLDQGFISGGIFGPEGGIIGSAAILMGIIALYFYYKLFLKLDSSNVWK